AGVHGRRHFAAEDHVLRSTGACIRDSRSGQVLILSGLSIFFLFGVMGLAVDLGYAFYVKQAAQAAADSAAVAAVNYAYKSGHYTCGSDGVVCGTALSCPSPVASVSTALLAGCAYADSNGFANSGRQTVSVIANNTAVNGASTVYWVQAAVTQSVSNFFGFAANITTQTVRASATAAIASIQPANASCIYALSSLSDTASGNLATNSCGINVGGNLSYSGSGNITTTQINAYGNFTDSGSGNITASGSILYHGTYSRTGSGRVSPAPVSGATPVTDPFSSLASPTVGSCDHTNYSYGGSSSTSISPGVYCGGITITGSGPVSFGTGTYILLGGGFRYSGSGNMSGTGVMFYNTGDATHTIAPVKLTGSGNMNFSAPSSGTYQGILFFQDRTRTYASANQITGSGNVSSGTFYFPTTELDYTGSGNAVYQALVANVVKITGSGNLTNDTTGRYTGFVKTSLVLIQ
ncbi:MAG TPA: pilus assembly protein TadG-related protein, partial [Bryobacteraceae bacterium]|nr:pilus assembly protein TadG-related protein [Bryobacteraceae bacterium]